MGYKPGKKEYELNFTDFPGLEITATSTALGRLMHLGTLNIQLNDPDETKRMELFTTFVNCLVSWNIEHPALKPGDEVCPECGLAEDAPMPCNITSLMCLDLEFIMPIMFGWMMTISRVSVPKELSLSDGGRNIQEALMRQLAQHQNLMTLPTPNLSSD